MSQFFRIHSENPQPRLIRQTVSIMREGGVIVYPTDTAYALGCHIGDRAALDRICAIRSLNTKHHFTLLCRTLADVGIYATFDTPVFRLLKANTPGPYTFVLRATREVPKRLQHPRKRTIGIRIPDHSIALALLEELREPMFTTTLILPGETEPMTDPEAIRERLERQVDLVIDGGYGDLDTTTLIDMLKDEPEIVREGRGDPEPFL